MSNSKTAVDQVMEQVQVFASAWALVGSRFDNGGQLLQANEEKAALREMLEEFIEQSEGRAETFLDALLTLQKWHASRVGDLNTLKEGARAGVTLRLGGEDASDLVITEEVASGMQLALDVALDFLGKLPFTLTHNGSGQDDQEQRG